MTTRVIWVPKAPCTPRSSFGGAVVNGKVYAVGGVTTGGSVTSDVEEYNPTTNVWTTKTSSPVARYNFACAAGDNNKVYAFAGRYPSGGWSTTTYIYNPALDSWTTGTPIGAAVIAFVAVNAPGSSHIYLFGGLSSFNTVLNTAQYYDTTANTFTTCTNMPTARYGLGAVYLNGIIYTIGGWDASFNGSSAVEAYNVATNTWATKASLPDARGYAFCFAYSGKIYVAGGQNASVQHMDTIFEYDPTTNTWVTLLDTTSVDRETGIAVIIGNSPFLIGGGPGNTTLSLIEQFSQGVTVSSNAFIPYPPVGIVTTVFAGGFIQWKTINSAATIAPRTGYAQVVSPGHFGGRTIGATVFGSPVIAIQSDASIALHSNSSQTIVIDTITSSTDPLYVLDLASVTPPSGYQNYDWAYDWVVRTYNGAACKFEARSANVLSALTSAIFTTITQGQIIPRADVRRYHQYRLHLWASGSNDFEFHQFTIKAYVDYPAYPYARTLASQIKTNVTSITLGVPVNQPDIIL